MCLVLSFFIFPMRAQIGHVSRPVSLWLCFCVFVCVCVCVCVVVCIGLCACVYMWGEWACTLMCSHALCERACLCVCVYVCVWWFAWVCVHVSTCGVSGHVH